MSTIRFVLEFLNKEILLNDLTFIWERKSFYEQAQANSTEIYYSRSHKNGIHLGGRLRMRS